MVLAMRGRIRHLVWYRQVTSCFESDQSKDDKEDETWDQPKRMGQDEVRIGRQRLVIVAVAIVAAAGCRPGSLMRMIEERRRLFAMRLVRHHCGS